MENPYIKQFPQLMAGKTVMYVHGFLSSAQSGTVKMLRELIPQATIIAEDLKFLPSHHATHRVTHLESGVHHNAIHTS